MIVLDRERGSDTGLLTITSRDAEDQALLMKFDRGTWTIIGRASEVVDSQAQQEILDFLKRVEMPQGPTVIARNTGRHPGSIPKTLNRMVRDGLIERVGRGLYKPAPEENAKF